jgi:hypothetical protein
LLPHGSTPHLKALWTGPRRVPRSPASAAAPLPLETILTVDESHLIVPVSNREKDPSGMVLLGIYDGEKLVRDFTVGLPQGEEAFWLAA